MRVEARPGPDGASPTTFPAEWGSPPRSKEERRAWIRRNIKDGQERRARGETVKWLAPERR